MKSVNWGIIGCGDVTELKSGPAFNKVVDSRLVAVMRRDAEKAKDYALRHGVPVYLTDADELINRTDINAVYVATPPETHSYYAIKAMNAGKAVYVEKPMAVNYSQCLEMLSVSQQKVVPLFVAYYRRTLPGYLKVKELLEDGVIGKPISVSIELMRPALESEAQGADKCWRVDAEKGGGGIFYDLASHQFDFLDFLFGPVKNCRGFCRNVRGLYKVEDTVTAVFEHENGVVGTGSWCFVANTSSKKDLIQIHGTNGRIVFSGFDHSPIKLITAQGEIEFPYLNPENIQYNLIKQVVESIQGNTRCVSDGISAARTNWVLENIVSDYYR